MVAGEISVLLGTCISVVSCQVSLGTGCWSKLLAVLQDFFFELRPVDWVAGAFRFSDVLPMDWESQRSDLQGPSAAFLFFVLFLTGKQLNCEILTSLLQDMFYF